MSKQYLVIIAIILSALCVSVVVGLALSIVGIRGQAAVLTAPKDPITQNHGLSPIIIIKSWLVFYENGQEPKSGAMTWLTWRESASVLLGKLLGYRQSKL